jgi:hypothetical protein
MSNLHEAVKEMVKQPSPEQPPEPQAETAAAEPTAPAQEAEQQPTEIANDFLSLLDTEAQKRKQPEQQEAPSVFADEYKYYSRLAKESPEDFLRHVGHVDLAEKLKPEEIDRTDKLENQVKELADKLAERDNEIQMQNREQAILRLRERVRQYVDGTDEYALTKGAGMHDLVFDRMHEHASQTGQALSEASAAKEVEEYLSGILTQWLEIPHVIEKAKARLQEKGELRAPQPRTSGVTISNSMAAEKPAEKSVLNPSSPDFKQQLINSLRFT